MDSSDTKWNLERTPAAKAFDSPVFGSVSGVTYKWTGGLEAGK
jgi:hypothetical protein